MSNDTNSYQPSRPDGMWTTLLARLGYGRVQPFASAVRGCSLISTVFGSQSPGGGRERGGGEGRGGGGVVKTVRSYLQSGGRERGRRVLGDSMGDVVLGYPRPGLDAGEAGRGEDCRYRHAMRASACSRGMGDRDQRV
ncbi:hypothetical protein PBY51_015835 [Eleginops maclovinus]|uniref:Uncharacterized protein n=1 Tax=Eleginops maclovinus TaxID=56733 RepID=A0AAN7XM41_ELEMC|nr:hypothetical protein PBY51_015835 [Eleginops maclovinus]